MKGNKVYLGLGTNVGNREKNLQIAIEEISQFLKIIKKSSIYETEPVGYKNQEKFFNMAIEIETELEPLELIFQLHEIEHKMGRKREQEIKNGPRIIDLDILLFGDLIINQVNFKIPHPRMHKRKFVLDPLNEIAAEILHPELKKSIKELHKNLSNESGKD